MKKLVVAASILMTASMFGCKDDVFEPVPYISNVEPDYVVNGRSKQVVVSGVVTEWTEGGTPFVPAIDETQVSFGEGVTVNSVEVLNHGTLLVDVTADPDAALGFRDVQVADLTFAGVFRVVPPFEVLDMSELAPGRFFQGLVQGYDTLWVKDVTTVDMGADIHFGPEEAGGAGPLYGIFDSQGVIGAQVLATDLVLVTGWVDAFAEGGTSLDMTISDYDGAEYTATGVVDLVDPILLTDMGGPQVLEDDYVNVIVEPSVPQGRSAKLRGSTTGAGFMLEFDPNTSGMAPVNNGPFYGDLNGYGDIGSLSMGYETSSSRLIFFDFLHSLGALYNALPGGLQVVDPETYPPGATHVFDLQPSPLLAEATPLAGETLQLQTYDPLLDPNWYDLGLTAPAIIDVTVTPAAGSTNLDAIVSWVGNKQQLPYEADATGAGAAELGSRVAGPYTIIGVSDAFSQTGAGTEYTVSYTSTPIPGTYFGSDAVLVPFGPTNAQSQITVNTGGGTVNEIHVFVNMEHAWIADARLILTAPSGETLQLCSGNCRQGYNGSTDGLLELYGDSSSTYATKPVTNLTTTFQGINADGNWTLALEDTFPYADDGRLVNWGLLIN